VVGDESNPFSLYYAEILRNEGLNEFDVVRDSATLSAATLDRYDVVIVGDVPLTNAQANALSTWVEGGGNLIAMRPDANLSSLLGLSGPSGTLSEGYLRVDTSEAPGRGIVGETIQYHGVADRYSLSGGAREVATLYSNATTATQNPAVTLRDVGSNGGQAAAFTYDLARSVIYTRQGNPAWEGQNRDGATTDPGLRPNDLFYPDYVNLDKAEIPQADEQQRLLANIIELTNRDKKPLPRFWYFPRAEEAVIIMTGDDHAGGSTDEYFDYFRQQSPQNCSVANWECVRGTSYIYPNTDLTDDGQVTAADDARAAQYEQEGFEVSIHVDTGCTNPWTPTSIRQDYTSQLAAFETNFPSVESPETHRTHCLAWSDYDTQPQVELDNGIRFDTNYYYWPGPWVQGNPGMFTGSGMPMRFATAEGSMIDVYQSTTQLTDEWGFGPASHARVLMDNAIGGSAQQSGDGAIDPQGYYGAFNANLHTDRPENLNSDAYVNGIVQYAKQHSVPVVTSRQMLDWLDGRNGSSFQDLSWDAGANELSFAISAAPGANGLQAMVPTDSEGGPLTGITRNGSPANYTTKTIKGIQYAFFNASNGDYVANYDGVEPDGPPTIAQNRPTGRIADRTPRISALVSDETTDLAKADIRLYVDGRRKTGFSYNAGTDRLTYDSTRLAYGPHTVEVRATDEAGNTTEKVWGFRVVKRG
jgi:hypothetical protein